MELLDWSVAFLRRTVGAAVIMNNLGGRLADDRRDRVIGVKGAMTKYPHRGRGTLPRTLLAQSTPCGAGVPAEQSGSRSGHAHKKKA